MPKQEFPFPMPNGWFCITRSHELKKGEVKSLKFCEKEIVAFRTESGTLAVLDAFCPHLGAHLGKGGCINGETIECPFHAWRWGEDGKCNDIPYSKDIPKGAEAKSWVSKEDSGFVYIWYDKDGKSPINEASLLEI